MITWAHRIPTDYPFPCTIIQDECHLEALLDHIRTQAKTQGDKNLLHRLKTAYKAVEHMEDALVLPCIPESVANVVKFDDGSALLIVFRLMWDGRCGWYAESTHVRANRSYRLMREEYNKYLADLLATNGIAAENKDNPF